jgi:uncharacterized membrane protein
MGVGTGYTYFNWVDAPAYLSSLVDVCTEFHPLATVRTASLYSSEGNRMAVTVTGRGRVLVLCVLALSLVAGSATPVASTDTTQRDLAPSIQTVPDTDTTTTRITPSENGSAEWELTIRMALETETDVEEFTAFQAAFEQNRSQYVGEFRDRMTRVVANAANATGREMTARNFTGETGMQQTPRRWGYVTYRFEWDGFARAEDGRIAVGDVFRGGYFLGEDDILVVTVPDGYEPIEIAPDPDRNRGGELQYNGPAAFENERPSLVFTTGEASNPDGGGDLPTGQSDESSLLLAVGGLLVVLVVAGLAYGRLRETDEERSGSDSLSGAASSTQPSPDDGQAGELATDEDRVRSLLESEGGRIRQADIADRLGWSDSKTSRVLSDMADDGDIEKLRIGRENVIDLVDDESQ